MNELGLCAGNGGLSLGLRLAVPSARAICLVEREAVVVADLVAKMEAGLLDEAPIWTDLATFDGRPWRGAVDLVSAGFPCQPFSAAGRVKGTKDERWLWPEIERVVRECEPAAVFIENVPGLVLHGLHDILDSLAKLGFNARWSLFSAAEIGAPHIRDRLFLLATHADSGGLPQEWCAGLRNGEQERRSDTDGRDRSVPHADDEGLQKREHEGCGPGRWTPAAGSSWWAAEPPVGRVVVGSADRVDRLRSLGNGVVPLVCAHAFRTLAARLALT